MRSAAKTFYFFLFDQLKTLLSTVPLIFQVFSKESTVFLRNSINHIMSEREQSGTVRNDLIDTLINLKNEDKSKHLSATNVGMCLGISKLSLLPMLTNHFCFSFPRRRNCRPSGCILHSWLRNKFYHHDFWIVRIVLSTRFANETS